MGGKEVLFQVSQGLRAGRATIQMFLLHRDSSLGGQPLHPGHGLLGRGEDPLLPRPVPIGEGQGNGMGLF